MSQNCIFCKIVAGQIPCTTVFEDDAAVAFLDIGPLADGHVLLVPKVHAATIDKMSPDHVAAVMRNVPALVRAVQTATGCQGVNVLQNNGVAAHQAVGHVHIHIIPRNAGDEFHFNWPAGHYPPGRAQELAEAIRKHLRA